MYINEINLEGLKEIYGSNPNAKIVLEYFTTRQLDENVVTIDDLQHLFQKKQRVIARQDIISIFKDLEKLRVGDFKIGRRTQKTRFVSKISLVSVGNAVVINKIDEGNRANQAIEQPQLKLEKVSEVSQENENNQGFGTEETTTVNKDEVKFFSYSFPLRSNIVIALRLPADLNNAEAERLTGFIKTLPYSTL